MSERLCLFCKNLRCEQPRFYESGGIPGGFECGKGHYEYEMTDDIADFRKLMLTAETCPDYTPDAPK